MAIHWRKEQIIKDNPNLSSSALARFLGIDRKTVARVKKSLEIDVLWKHSGIGIPFTSTYITEDGLFTEVVLKGRTISKTNKTEVTAESVDRLIYCLENNNGKLPTSNVEGWSLENLKFIKS